LEFSTFNPKFFRILKFRAENFSAREISIQKNLGRKNFRASVPGAIGRAGVCRGPYATSERCEQQGVFPDFAMIVRKILGRKNFRAGKKPENWGKMGDWLGRPGHHPFFL
jgi:hypothetical protein